MSETQVFPPLVIELVNLTETAWTMEGSEKDPTGPKRMSWPSLYRIIPTSKVRVDIPEEKGGGYRFEPIRYIAGCDFIDPVRQDKEGYKPNMEQDNIWINGGSLTVLHEGADIGKYLYLKAYQGNRNNPLRPPDAEIEFEEKIQVEIAKSQIVTFDKKADAYAILREVRWHVEGADEDLFEYNEEKLSLMSTLFNLNSIDTPEEKFLELCRIADTNPELIVSSIANSKKKLFATIKKAEDLAVITFTEDRVFLSDTKTVILAYKGRVAKNNQINKLADFLLTEDGSIYYQQINQAIETASDKSMQGQQKRVLSNQIS